MLYGKGIFEGCGIYVKIKFYKPYYNNLLALKVAGEYDLITKKV